jgi:membrane protease YdiL (CAAX protease family)
MTEPAPTLEHSDEPRATVKQTLGGLAIAYVGTAAWFVVAAMLRVSDLVTSPNGRQIIGLSWAWLLTAALLLYVVRVERRSLSSIGFRGTRWTAYALTPAWWIVNVITSLAFVQLFLRNADTSAGEALLHLPVGTKIAIVITAGVTEEVLFRSYAIERITEVTGRLWLAGAITAAMFVAFHMPYFGVVPGLARLPGAILLTVVYIRRRSLGPVIVLHAMFDLPLVFVDS